MSTDHRTPDTSNDADKGILMSIEVSRFVLAAIALIAFIVMIAQLRSMADGSLEWAANELANGIIAGFVFLGALTWCLGLGGFNTTMREADEAGKAGKAGSSDADSDARR